MTEDEMVGWHHRLNGHDLSKLWELVVDREAFHWQTCDHLNIKDKGDKEEERKT